MPLELPALPYDMSALEPHISKETLEFHYGKHHQTYVTNGNKLISGTDFDEMPIAEIIKATANNPDNIGIFNNVAQVWNHSFYWHSMKPNGGGVPTGTLANKIVDDFGSYEAFKEQFAVAGATQFGSGWAWLVFDQGNLKIVKTANAGTPLVKNQAPLLTMDVWEHAYYIDFRNARPKYIETFLNNLINWDFAQQNFEQL